MAGNLDDTLNEVGYAQVIVTLADTAAAGFEDERALRNAFIDPSPRQTESLVLAAAHVSSDEGRGRAAARARLEDGDTLVAPAPPMRRYPRLGLATGYVDRRGAAALRGNRRVDRVDEAPALSLIRPVARRDIPEEAAAAAVAAGEISWGLRRLEVPQVWNAGFTGAGVTVAHLDTGIDASHPAFEGRDIRFAEFDLFGDAVANATPWDSGEHGTHTAGTIVGRPGPLGSFGVAPDASLASAMVIEGGNVIDRILGGLEWSLVQDARVLSMSLGLRNYTSAFQTIIDALIANNVLPVIAIGNEYANSSRSPGNYANVLSVGACDADDNVADFSSSQRFNRADDPQTPDLVAPGVGILSCVPGGHFAEMDGSSMATPHIAGVAALLVQANPGATVGDLQDAIFGSCARPSSMSTARANRGLPNAFEALRIITSS